MKRGGRIALLAALWLAVIPLGITACDPLVVNAFVGQLYDPTNQCLKPKSVIDVIEGEAHGTCEGVRCMVDEAGDAFITTRCETPPGFEDHTADDRDRQCRLALEVYALEDDGACPDDEDAGE